MNDGNGFFAAIGCIAILVIIAIVLLGGSAVLGLLFGTGA